MESAVVAEFAQAVADCEMVEVAVSKSAVLSLPSRVPLPAAGHSRDKVSHLKRGDS